MAPVHEAARRNDVEELRRLLDEEPGLLEEEEEEDYPYDRPLHAACHAGSMEAACFLLYRGADIESRNVHEYTPLMRACSAGRAEVVSMLLARGADPAAVSSQSWTALMCASRGHERRGVGYVEIIRLLLKDGRGRVDARNMHGHTALWLACYWGRTAEARVLLLEGRADHTIPYNEGVTPMGAAQGKNGGECTRLLKWYEGELERACLLSKARAVVDATESISKAPEKVGAKTRGEAQRAREAAAPAYLRGRVVRGEALPSVEVVGQAGQRDDDEEEELCAVYGWLVGVVSEDLHMELMEGLRYRRWVPGEAKVEGRGAAGGNGRDA